MHTLERGQFDAVGQAVRGAGANRVRGVVGGAQQEGSGGDPVVLVGGESGGAQGLDRGGDTAGSRAGRRVDFGLDERRHVVIVRTAPEQFEPGQVRHLEEVIIPHAQHRPDGPDHSQVGGGEGRSVPGGDAVAGAEDLYLDLAWRLGGFEHAEAGPATGHGGQAQGHRLDGGLGEKRLHVAAEDAHEQVRERRRVSVHVGRGSGRGRGESWWAFWGAFGSGSHGVVLPDGPLTTGLSDLRDRRRRPHPGSYPAGSDRGSGVWGNSDQG